MTICYSCKKEIGFFQRRGTINDITRAGYKPLEGMSKGNVLCQACCDEIKRTQTQGQKLGERVNMIGQIILCLVFPIWAFWRIEKLGKFLLYWLIVVAIVTAVFLIPYSIDKDSSVTTVFVIGVMLFLVVGGWTVPIYWIIKWTKEYNRNSIGDYSHS